MAIRLLICLLCSSALLLGACSDDPTEPDEGVPTVLRNVIVVEDYPMDYVGSDGGAYFFLLTGPAPQINNGDILVLPIGQFRKVTSVSVEGESMTIYTTTAKLTDAVESCQVDKTVPLELGFPGDYGRVIPEAKLTDNSIRLTNYELWSGEVAGEIGSAYLGVFLDSLLIEVNNYQLNYGYTILNSRLSEYHSVRSAVIDLECGITVEAAAVLKFDPSVEIYQKVQQVWTGAPFPMLHCIVTTVTFGVEVNARAQANAGLAGLGAKNNVRHGTRYSGGSWSPVRKVEMAPRAGEPRLSARVDLEVKPYVKFEVEDKFYCDPGASIYAKPYVSATASFDTEPKGCLDVEVGCEIGCTASIDLWDDLDLSYDSGPILSPSENLYHNCWNFGALDPSLSNMGGKP